jgi:hypothetical protein
MARHYAQTQIVGLAPHARRRNKKRTLSREIPASPPADDKALTQSQVERLFPGTAKESVANDARTGEIPEALAAELPLQ